MIVLAVDSSALAVSVAIMEEDRLICEITVNNRLNHSETLLPQIISALKAALLKPTDVDIFAAAQGPGSFTGLRIGVGTVKGLAYAADKPVIGIPTTEGLAYNLPFSPHPIYAIMDARRGEVYNGVYKYSGGALTEQAAPRALPLEALAQEICGQAVFVGDGVAVHRHRLIELLGERALLAPPQLCIQRASSVALAAFAHIERAAPPQELTPVYIRKSQAERNLFTDSS